MRGVTPSGSRSNAGFTLVSSAMRGRCPRDPRQGTKPLDPASRVAGFTLVEILVVIAIIGILASMVIGLVSVAQRRARSTKAKSNISVLAVALEAYNNLNGIYPGGGRAGAARDDPEAMFIGLYTGNLRIGGSRESHLEDWPPEQIGKWTGSYLDVYQTPNDAELDFSAGAASRCVLLDPWGRAFHYVEFDSRAGADRILQGGQLRARTGQKFAIWSDGPNGINEYGKEDDVTSWSEFKSSASGASGGGS